MKSGKLLALLLSLLLASTVLASCVETGNKDNPETDTAQAATTVAVETIDENYVANLPDENFKGIEFNILCEGNFWATDANLYQEEDSDDPVDSAIFRRNAKVNEQFGVTIKVTPSADTTSALSNSVKSGDKAYNAVIARMPLIASSAANGNLLDLNQVDSIDLTKYYWDQGANAQLSIKNKLFYTIGDIMTTDDNATWTMMFNKSLASKYDLENLYGVVKAGKWTFDYFKTIVKEKGISSDSNGDGERNHLDTYAFATHMDMGYGFFYAAGLSFVQKDETDTPYIGNSNAEKIQAVLEYSVDIMRNDYTTLDAHKWVAVRPAAHELIAEAFVDNRALFFCEVLSTIIGFRSMDTDFGILPLPKYDENQAQYLTFVNPAASLVGIPLYWENDSYGHTSGVILEAMAYYGHEIISPEYYDKAIEGKSTRDVESIEMLDIILNNRMYDLGLINDWGSLASSYNGLVFNGKTDYASMYSSKSKAAIKKLEKFLTSIGE